MSTPARRQPSTELAARSTSALHGTTKPAVKRDSLSTPQGLKSSTTRRWSTLQEHAEHVRSASGDSTPNVDDRREGFAWGEDPDEEVQTPKNARGVSSREPKGSAKGVTAKRTVSVVKDNPFALDYARTFTLQNKPSTESFKDNPNDIPNDNPHDQFVRSDTMQSSVSSIGRGVQRAVPDMRMFAPAPASPKDEEVNREDPRWPSRAGRKLSFIIPQAVKRISSMEKQPKLPTMAEEKPKSETKPDQTKGGGLKDRRKLKNSEAMKLTLPLNMPNLPARQRNPIPESIQLMDIAPPRARSPKTPWIRDSWLPDANAPNATPSRLEALSEGQVNEYGQGLLPGTDPIRSTIMRPGRNRDRRFVAWSSDSIGRTRKSRNRTSDSSLAQTSDRATSPSIEEQALRRAPTQDLRKRSRKKRWGGQWTSTSNEADDAEDYTQENTCAHPDRRASFLSISRFFRPKKPNRRRSVVSQVEPPHAPRVPPVTISEVPTLAASNLTPSAKMRIPSPLRTKSRNKLAKDAIKNMPNPPTFVPPGLNRVATPPIADQQGDVKEKLADFFFEFPGSSQKRPMPRSPASAGLPTGIWNSDALLMSQHSNITSGSSNSDSPRYSSPSPSPVDYINSPTGYMGYSPNPHPHSPWPHLQPPSSAAISYPNPYSPLLHPSSPSPNAPKNYFRVHFGSEDSGDFSLEAEQCAKFKWITPEHLPSSPLCPLNRKYKGPSPGMCVFHGRRRGSVMGKGKGRRESGRGGGLGGTGMMRLGLGGRTWSSDTMGTNTGTGTGTGTGTDTPASEQLDVLGQGKRRRLASLSSP